MKGEPLRYMIATHGWLDGVRLSRLGAWGWGNIEYPDEAAALAAAQTDARKTAFTIERKHIHKPRLSGILS